MSVRRVRGQIAVVGTFLALTAPLAAHAAQARTPHHAAAAAHTAGTHAASAHVAAIQHGMRRSGARFASRRGVHYAALQCVPFARSESGIELSGNAATWWDHAEGMYARGNRPEVGSVLNFRANARMRMGHVAVVTAVVNSREVEIDQANWGGGRVSRDVPVVDVSQNNDWTAVRVGLGGDGDYGSIYPTYGFIYDRADSGDLLASAPSNAPAPALNPPPRDLRDAAEVAGDEEEVADAPADAAGIATPRPLHASAHRKPRHHTTRHHTSG
jgi:surface antigen